MYDTSDGNVSARALRDSTDAVHSVKIDTHFNGCPIALKNVVILVLPKNIDPTEKQHKERIPPKMSSVGIPLSRRFGRPSARPEWTSPTPLYTLFLGAQAQGLKVTGD